MSEIASCQSHFPMEDFFSIFVLNFKKIVTLDCLQPWDTKRDTYLFRQFARLNFFLYLQNPAQPSDTNPFCGYNFVSGPLADTKTGVL